MDSLIFQELGFHQKPSMAQALSAVPSQSIVFNSLVVMCVLFLVLFYPCCQLVRFILNLPILSRLETRLPAQVQMEKLCQWNNRLFLHMCSWTSYFIKITTCPLHWLIADSQVFRIICNGMNYPLVLLQNLHYNKQKSICFCFVY